MDADTDEATQAEECSRPGDGGDAERETFTGPPETDSSEGGEETLGRPGWVYFIETDDARFIKIGFSVDVARRFTQIGVLMPGLRLIGYMPGSIETERWFHGKFASNRENGEWFRNTDEIRQFIAALGLIPAPAPLKDRPEPDMQREPKLPRARSGKFINLLIPDDLMTAIENFRYDSRIPSRVEAMKILMRLGLAAGNGKRGKTAAK